MEGKTKMFRCFIRKNTPHLRHVLEVLGFTTGMDVDDEPWLYVAGTDYHCTDGSDCSDDEDLVNTYGVDCLEDEDLFISLVSMYCIQVRGSGFFFSRVGQLGRGELIEK